MLFVTVKMPPVNFHQRYRGRFYIAVFVRLAISTNTRSNWNLSFSSTQNTDTSRHLTPQACLNGSLGDQLHVLSKKNGLNDFQKIFHVQIYVFSL